MRQRPAPMTAETAREVVAELQRKASRRAQIALLGHALGPLGNLSDDARAIYRAKLDELRKPKSARLPASKPSPAAMARPVLSLPIVANQEESNHV
jgi:hypothetical protein